MQHSYFFTRLCGLCLFGFFSLQLASANVVLDWNALMIDAIRVDNSGPTLSSRNLAILHTAIYDAVNSVTRSHNSYRVFMPVSTETSPEAAAVAAAYTITKALYPGISGRADSLYETFLAGMERTHSLSNGVTLGVEAARQILLSRADDGANTEIPYIPGEAPGDWRRTPPFFRPPVTPHWRSVHPFGIPNASEFVPPAPPDLAGAEYAAALNEVQALGAKQSSARTAYDTETAVFWSDFSYTSMPPGHWHLITAEIARSRPNSLHETARLLALLSIAQADAAIVCWEAKYRYNLWRPVTAIRNAASDGNPETEEDPAWDLCYPHLHSPPISAATVLSARRVRKSSLASTGQIRFPSWPNLTVCREQPVFIPAFRRALTRLG